MGVGVNLSFVCSFEGWGVGTRFFLYKKITVEDCIVHFFLFMGDEYKFIPFVFGELRGGYKSFSFFFFI